MGSPRKTDGDGDGDRDGRVRRGARNHQAIVDAMYELVRTTHAPPTMDEVARRAGVGTRTVFRQFQDLESLFRTMNERLLGEILGMVTLTPPTGDLATDLRALAHRRAKVFEHISPFRHATRGLRHTSTFLREQDARFTHMLRAMLETTVRPHLAEDAQSTLEILDLLLSFEAWDRLRETQKLGAKAAEQAISDAALALAMGPRASGRTG
jgi:AcrR family transcriptional regulator